jgi:hypothetical protein
MIKAGGHARRDEPFDPEHQAPSAPNGAPVQPQNATTPAQEEVCFSLDLSVRVLSITLEAEGKGAIEIKGKEFVPL